MGVCRQVLPINKNQNNNHGPLRNWGDTHALRCRPALVSDAQEGPAMAA
jgi:hypothetical protein